MSELNSIQYYTNNVERAQSQLQQDAPGTDQYTNDSVYASDEQTSLQQTTQQLQEDQPAFIQAALLMILPGILFWIPWIGTLVNLGRARAWTWFFLTLFFGGIMVLIYWVGGPDLPKKQAVAVQSSAPSHNNPSPEMPTSLPSQASSAPQSFSALEILQQRYVRSEIDTATFQHMLAQLETSMHPNSQ